jgi:hypothetical protein
MDDRIVTAKHHPLKAAHRIGRLNHTRHQRQRFFRAKKCGRAAILISSERFTA